MPPARRAPGGGTVGASGVRIAASPQSRRTTPLLHAAHARWLRDQLPLLVAAGVLTPEAAERLGAHYAGDEASSGPRLVVLLFGVLGALFVGGGVILVLAHNWGDLSRPTRTALSLLPLAASLALAAWVLATERGEGWREACGALWTLAIGSSISLVGQTYHLPGDWTTFLRIWLLLAVPVLYLLRSVTASLLYCLGLLVWALDSGGDPLQFWPLLALAAPWFAWRLRRHPDGAGSEVLGWTLAGTLLIALVPSLERFGDEAWGPLLASLLLAFWAGAAVAQPRRWERPFRIVGGLGFAVLGLVLSYAQPWRDQGGHDEQTMGLRLAFDSAADREAGWRLALEGSVAALLAVAALGLLALAWQRRGATALPLAAGLPAVWAGWLLARADSDQVAAAVMNVYLLALGALMLVQGKREDSLRRANAGAGILGILILLRFFDSDWGFLLRGSAFIAVGLGFLFVNSALLRKRRPA